MRARAARNCRSLTRVSGWCRLGSYRSGCPGLGPRRGGRGGWGSGDALLGPGRSPEPRCRRKCTQRAWRDVHARVYCRRSRRPCAGKLRTAVAC
jgi:hypothetical protein